MMVCDGVSGALECPCHPLTFLLIQWSLNRCEQLSVISVEGEAKYGSLLRDCVDRNGGVANLGFHVLRPPRLMPIPLIIIQSSSTRVSTM